MAASPAQEPSGWEEDLAWLDRDPMTAAEREAWLDRLCAQDDDPFDDPQEYWDPESCAPPPGQDELTAEELAGVAEAAADEMLALDAASTGRRGPGQAGSARTFPGESASRAAGFGVGMAWDVMPGCAQLAVAADAAVDGGGAGDSFGGVADQELVGLVCAWDRVEAHAAARKLVAIAEVFRRNPEDGFEPEPGELVGLVCAFDRAEAHMAARKLVAIAEVFRRNPEDGFEPAPGRMPAVVHEFTRDQLAFALGESRAAADWLLTVSWHLATRLGGTLDALADGIITRGKAELIVRLTQYLSATGRDHHPGQGRADRPAHPVPVRRGSQGGGGQDPRPGRAADPRRAAFRRRSGRHGSRAEEGQGAAGDRGEVRPGGAVGRGLRQRRADGTGAAAGRGAGVRSADLLVGW